MVPFYEDSMAEESDASSEDEDNAKPRWCTVRKDTHVNGYGDAAAYIGLEFSRSTVEEGDLANGVIESVVRKRDCLNNVNHFKLVNDRALCNFVPCKTLMSTSKSNVFKVRNVMNLYFVTSMIVKM